MPCEGRALCSMRRTRRQGGFSRFGRALRARARLPSPEPSHPSPGSSTDPEAATGGHFCHSLSVPCCQGASHCRCSLRVERRCRPASLRLVAVVWRSRAAREQRWSSKIRPPDPVREAPAAAAAGRTLSLSVKNLSYIFYSLRLRYGKLGADLFDSPGLPDGRSYA